MLAIRCGGTAGLLFCLTLAGCAAPSLYEWGTYERGLTHQYIDNDPEQARAEIERTVSQVEHGEPRRVPPGLYADYGFLLYQRGDYAHAIDCFQREATLFPESAALMTKLVEKTKERQGGGTPRPAEGSQ